MIVAMKSYLTISCRSAVVMVVLIYLAPITKDENRG
jgi:hypothetical protein